MPVSYNNNRFILSNTIYRVMYNAFTILVKSACRFVEDVNIHITQELSCKYNTLLLSSVELDTSLANNRLQFIRQTRHKIPYIRFLTSSVKLIIHRISFTILYTRQSVTSKPSTRAQYLPLWTDYRQPIKIRFSGSRFQRQNPASGLFTGFFTHSPVSP